MPFEARKSYPTIEIDAQWPRVTSGFEMISAEQRNKSTGCPRTEHMAARAKESFLSSGKAFPDLKSISKGFKGFLLMVLKGCGNGL